MQKLTCEQIGILWITSASIAYGMMPIWSVFVQDSGISTEYLLLFRFICTALLLFSWSIYKKISLKLPMPYLFKFLFLGGVLYIVQSFAYLDSLRFIPASLSVLLYHIYPAIVALIAIFFLKDKITPKMLFCLITSFIGLVVILQPSSYLALNFYGIFLSLVGALFYGLYVIFSKNLAQKFSSIVCSFYVCLFASLAILCYIVIDLPNLQNIKANGILALLGLTFVSTLFPMIAYFLGMSKIGVTKTAILGMIEPLVGVLLSLWILGESLTLIQCLGACLIFFGSILLFIKH